MIFGPGRNTYQTRRPRRANAGTVVQHHPHRRLGRSIGRRDTRKGATVILLRRLLGDVLRRRRQGQGRTLREVSALARVSLGYLSEIERGQKEASSELLASICDALGVRMSDVMREVSDSLAVAEFDHVGGVRALEPVGSVASSPRELAGRELASLDIPGRDVSEVVAAA
jgi:transcriptional regulator with XRE-family HTH domain